MEQFDICKQCSNEYENSKDRRFYAQTISCDSCGVQLELFNPDKILIKKGHQDIVDMLFVPGNQEVL